MLINSLRGEVERWRYRDYERVTPTSRKLLQHWAEVERDNRVLFCQREAAETAIFLAEVAGRHGYTDWRRQNDYNYVTRHVPFLFFKSIADSPTCKDIVVDYSNFVGDLAKTATTPDFSFIVPNTCNDGHEATCVDGSTGGITAINKYLEIVVPQITESPAFKKDGLLLILFDEAEFDGDDESSNGCCGAPLGPNTASLGGLVPGSGGGRTGGIAISKFIKPGTVSQTPNNHYSTLRTVEDIFGQSYLGYANNDSVQSYGSDVLTAPNG